MSYYDYKKSQKISAEGYPFYALVMACMRQADTHNAKILQLGFPDVWMEFLERYNAPGGLTKAEFIADAQKEWENGTKINR